MSDNDCPDPPECSKNILYVVFHGELAFVDIPGAQYIRVYAPKVPTHVYMAGPWLGENQIPLDTTLTLVGVYGGNATLAQSKIISFGQQSESRPVAAHFEIRLPRPDKILDGYVISLRPGAFTIGKKNPVKIEATEMDLRPIFQYTMTDVEAYLADLDDVSDLDDEQDNRNNWSARLGCDGFYSLHVFAEENIVMNDKDHTSEATESAGRILGVNEVVAHDSQAVGIATSAGHIDGLHPSEHRLTLERRTSLVAELGAQLRRGEKLTWNFPSIGVENHASCGPARP